MSSGQRIDELIPFTGSCSSKFFSRIIKRTCKSFPDAPEPLKTANELEAIRRCVELN